MCRDHCQIKSQGALRGHHLTVGRASVSGRYLSCKYDFCKTGLAMFWFARCCRLDSTRHNRRGGHADSVARVLDHQRRAAAGGGRRRPSAAAGVPPARGAQHRAGCSAAAHGRLAHAPGTLPWQVTLRVCCCAGGGPWCQSLCKAPATPPAMLYAMPNNPRLVSVLPCRLCLGVRDAWKWNISASRSHLRTYARHALQLLDKRRACSHRKTATSIRGQRWTAHQQAAPCPGCRYSVPTKPGGRLRRARSV